MSAGVTRFNQEFTMSMPKGLVTVEHGDLHVVLDSFTLHSGLGNSRIYQALHSPNAALIIRRYLDYGIYRE